LLEKINMINKDRLLNNFFKMVKIYSPSKKEREMADYIIVKLKKLGLDIYEDAAGQKIDGNAGNVIGYLKGNRPGKTLMFSAHLDTVEPSKDIVPVLEDGVIKSAGNTILGSDDKAGITAILEMLHNLVENEISHPDIYVIFSVAEEIGLLGATHFDETKHKIDYGFILDANGAPGVVIKQAREGSSRRDGTGKRYKCANGCKQSYK